MALTNEDLQAIAGLLKPIQDEVRDVKSDMQDMGTGMKELKSDMQRMKSEVEDVKSEVQQMRIDVKDLKNRVVKIELTVENEIRVNIQRVAEGHLDLYRKLNECIKLSSDVVGKQEIHDIYIKMHENKLKALA